MAELFESSHAVILEDRLFHDHAPEEIIRILGPVLSRDRRERIDAVVAARTRRLAVVVEGVLNTGNVSAVMRTAEALGFQDFHVITNDQPFKHSSRTTTGAEKWLDVRVWRRVSDCVAHLHEGGCRVVAASLDEAAVPIGEVDFTKKTALVFGNELNGISDEMQTLSDERCVLPVVGFVRSYNVSVAAAMALHEAFRRRTAHGSGDLSEAEALRLRAAFYIRSVESAARILARPERTPSRSPD